MAELRLPWRKSDGETPEVSVVPLVDASPISAPAKTDRGYSVARDYVYPDYVDRDALLALAEALGVSLDPVEVGFTRSATEGSSTSDETGAAIRVPVAEISGRSSSSTSKEVSLARSIAVQRRHTMRSIVDELTQGLRGQDALVEDLITVPDNCINEMILGAAGQQAVIEWGLTDIDWRQPESGEVESDNEAERQAASAAFTTGFDPHQPTTAQLAVVMTTVDYAASAVVAESLLSAAEGLLQRAHKSLFTRITMDWPFWEGDEPHLWNAGLHAPGTTDVVSWGPTSPVLRVPIDPEKLNSLARGRYVSGPAQPLEVFAKIERVDREAGEIVLMPIVILSP